MPETNSLDFAVFLHQTWKIRPACLLFISESQSQTKMPEGVYIQMLDKIALVFPTLVRFHWSLRGMHTHICKT